MFDAVDSRKIWDRQNEVSDPEAGLSRKFYMFLVCFWTAAGLAFSAYTSTYSQHWNYSNWKWWELVGVNLAVLVVAIIGCLLSAASDSAVTSVIGYALVSGPFGLLLGPVVAMHDQSTVIKVFTLTALIVVVLGTIGALIPNDLSRWGRPLFGALLLFIVGLIAVPLFGVLGVPVHGALTVLQWFGLVVFGGLVIFDLNRAARLPRTHNNAVDSALAIYLDVINLLMIIFDLSDD